MPREALQQVYLIGGEGTIVNNRAPSLVAIANELGIGDTIAAAGGPDHNRATLFHTETIPLTRGVPLTVKPEEVEESFGYLADQDYASRRASVRRALGTRINDRALAHLRALKLHSPFGLHYYSWTSGHRQANVERLEDLKVRLPGTIQLGVTYVPHEPHLRDDIRNSPDFPAELKDRGLLDCTILVDNLSAIVKRHGRPFQDQLADRGIVSAMASIWHFANQRSIADAARALGRYAALVGVSYGLRHFLPDPEVAWYKPVRQLFGWAPKGQGHLDDMVQALVEAGRDAITNPAWRSIDQPVDLTRPAFMAVTFPAKQHDMRIWRGLVAEVERYFANEYPTITLLWTSGAGTPHPQIGAGSPYPVQCTLFSCLPDRPAPIQAIVDRPCLVRRPRKEPEAGSNGAGHDEALDWTRVLAQNNS